MQYTLSEETCFILCCAYPHATVQPSVAITFIFTIVTLQLKCVEKDSVISFSEKTFLADLINLISLDFASHIEVCLIKDLHNVLYFVLGGPYHC